MDLTHALNFLPLLVVVSAAAVEDLRDGKVPNRLTISLALTGLLISLLPGRIGAGQSVLGLAVGFVPPFVLFAIGAMGGGDVKLLAAVGAWVGPRPMMDILVLVAVTAAILAVLQSLWQRRLLFVFHSTVATAMGLLSQGGVDWERQRQTLKEAAPGRTVPYALSVFIGIVLASFVPAACFWRGH